MTMSLPPYRSNYAVGSIILLVVSPITFEDWVHKLDIYRCSLKIFNRPWYWTWQRLWYDDFELDSGVAP